MKKLILCFVLLICFFIKAKAQSNANDDTARVHWVYKYYKEELSGDSTPYAYVIAKEDINAGGLLNLKTEPVFELELSTISTQVSLRLTRVKFKIDEDGYVYPLINFDNGPTFKVRCSVQKDDKVLIFIKSDSLLNRVKNTKTLWIRAKLDDGQSRVMEFNVANLKWPYKAKNNKETVLKKQNGKNVMKKRETLADSVDLSWRFSYDIDKMTSDTVHFASALAKEELDFDFPNNGGAVAMFVVDMKDSTNYVSIQLDKGQFHFDINDKIRVRVRFDDEKPFYVDCDESDGIQNNIWFENPDAIIDKLKKAKRVLVEAEFFMQGTRIMEFYPGQLVWNHMEAKPRKNKK